MEEYCSFLIPLASSFSLTFLQLQPLEAMVEAMVEVRQVEAMVPLEAMQVEAMQVEAMVPLEARMISMQFFVCIVPVHMKKLYLLLYGRNPYLIIPL